MQQQMHGATSSFLGAREALAGRVGPSRGSGRKKAVTKMGLPIVGWVINPITVFFAYALGAARFASGFAKTSYNNNLPTKVALAALWPVLYLGKNHARKPAREHLTHRERERDWPSAFDS